MTRTAIPAAGEGLPRSERLGELETHGMTRRRVLSMTAVTSVVAASGGLAVTALAEKQPDPALVAIAAWERAWIAAWGEHGTWLLQEDSPEHAAATEAEQAAHNTACETPATTAPGLAAQLRFAYGVFGSDWRTDVPGYRRFEPYSEPQAYEFSEWTNDRGRMLLDNMLATAEAMAGA